MESQVKNTASPKSNPVWDRITDVFETKKTGEIAKILKLSPSSISDWKHGRTKPSLPVLEDIAFYGETTVDYLLNGDETKRFQQGDDSSFEEWFLPADYRPKLKAIAESKNKAISEIVRELIIDGINRWFSDEAFEKDFNIEKFGGRNKFSKPQIESLKEIAKNHKETLEEIVARGAKSALTHDGLIDDENEIELTKRLYNTQPYQRESRTIARIIKDSFKDEQTKIEVLNLLKPQIQEMVREEMTNQNIQENPKPSEFKADKRLSLNFDKPNKITSSVSTEALKNDAKKRREDPDYKK